MAKRKSERVIDLRQNVCMYAKEMALVYRPQVKDSRLPCRYHRSIFLCNLFPNNLADSKLDIIHTRMNFIYSQQEFEGLPRWILTLIIKRCKKARYIGTSSHFFFTSAASDSRCILTSDIFFLYF